MNATLLMSISLVLAQIEPQSSPPPPATLLVGAPLTLGQSEPGKAVPPPAGPRPVSASLLPPTQAVESSKPASSAGPRVVQRPQGKGFLASLIRAYLEEFRKKDDAGDDSPPAARRALPEPWSSPPFPGHEFQGYPLIGVPASSDVYPLMKAINDCTAGTPLGDCIKESKIKVDGWLVGSGNVSTAKNSNLPSSYWVVPNRLELDQGVLRISRDLDSVQTDHVDWGFRSVSLYGIDYRYTTAGGYLSDQLLRHNRLYGYDPTEQYFDLYVPNIFQGLIVRVGRWIACPDIETQYGPDNYMGSHSLLFTYDSYTQTGVMLTFKLTDHLMVQGAIHAGTDMAPWYPGATPTGFFGVRWVAPNNNDAVYTVLNNINDARFRRLEIDGQTAGHDNFNYVVSTWEHKFSAEIHTKTEAYFMWQRDAYTGGTVSVGPPQSFGGGGGAGTFIPGYSLNYGLVNFTMFGLSKKDYLTVRNELWNDPQGERTGYRSLYSSHTIGWSHNFNAVMQIRPEIGFYHSYGERAFDLGATRNMVMAGFDFTFRF